MSFQAMAWAWKLALPTPAHKLALMALCDSIHAAEEDDDLINTCFPSQRYIGEICNLSRSRINGLLVDLERLGAIEKMPRTRDNGSTTSCLYRVLCPRPDPKQIAPRPEAKGFVYVMTDGQLTKVGISTNIEQRLNSIHRVTGRKISLVKSYPMKMGRAREIEKLAFAELAECRTRGEWFSCDPLFATEKIKDIISATPPVGQPTPPCPQADTSCPSTDTTPVRRRTPITSLNESKRENPILKKKWETLRESLDSVISDVNAPRRRPLERNHA